MLLWDMFRQRGSRLSSQSHLTAFPLSTWLSAPVLTRMIKWCMLLVWLLIYLDRLSLIISSLLQGPAGPRGEKVCFKNGLQKNIRDKSMHRIYLKMINRQMWPVEKHTYDLVGVLSIALSRSHFGFAPINRLHVVVLELVCLCTSHQGTKQVYRPSAGLDYSQMFSRSVNVCPRDVSDH